MTPLSTHASTRSAIARGEYETARRLLQAALAQRPEDTDAMCLLALALWRGPGEMDGAASQLQRARTLCPADPRILTLSASLVLHLGELEAAVSFAEQALAADIQHAPAYVVLSRSDPRRVNDSQLKCMLSLAQGAGLGPRRLRPLHNAIGRVYDARGEFDAAFGHFERSNALAQGCYQPGLHETRLAQTREFFTPQFFEPHRRLGVRGAGCVFVIGMPRSGSTLVEQMLAAHPQTGTCHESDALNHVEASWRRALPAQPAVSGDFEHYRAIDAGRLAHSARAYLGYTARQMRIASPARRIDKHLSNFLHMPLIALMFPDAVALHTHRHPLDVCLSCFTQGFDGHWYANDLNHLAHFYLTYMDYMRLWSSLFPGLIHHCRYEDIVADFEPQARRIVRGTGLEWHDACAQPHLAGGFVSTASAAQVREPVHQARTQRWRQYEKHLWPLIAALGGHAQIERMHREFS